MSGQMADVIVIDDEEFAVVEPEPGQLFEPRDLGLAPVMTHTANTRGVLARYRVTEEGRLLLSDLQIGHLEQPPAIDGIEPTTDEYGQVWTTWTSIDPSTGRATCSPGRRRSSICTCTPDSLRCGTTSGSWRSTSRTVS